MQILLQTSSPPSGCFHLGDKDSFFKTRFSGIKISGQLEGMAAISSAKLPNGN